MNLIYRSTKDKEHPYVMVLRETLYDKNLSLKAKGLLCFILSKPTDWQIYVIALAKELKESKNTIASTLKELIDTGYCVRKYHVRTEGKFNGFDYIIFESLNERKEWEAKYDI